MVLKWNLERLIMFCCWAVVLLPIYHTLVGTVFLQVPHSCIFGFRWLRWPFDMFYRLCYCLFIQIRFQIYKKLRVQHLYAHLQSYSSICWLPPAANHFGLDHLKQLCEIKLCEEVSAETVVTTLCLADQHCCSQLKAICLKFAAANLGGAFCP